MAKRGLGRGLSALIPDIETITGQEIRELPINEIQPNPFQPRKRFDESKLAELAESIRQHGIVQPLVVRQKGDTYELVVGQRRLQAARIIGLETVPVIVNAFEDIEMVQVALIENLQREDLNVIEEAEAYKRLIEEFGMTQEELARVLGKSRPAITNTIRLLNLSPEVQEIVSRGTISMGHARALLAVDDLRLQEKVCRYIVDKQLSVRETEEVVRRVVATGRLEKAKARKNQMKDPHIVSIEERLRRVLGTQVRVCPGKKKGKIEIEYYSDEDLERILSLVL
ncbi:MAG: ParB/RepB/Spo0J family partition protein [Firmicutes bacterium]|nr:ParB/RepB/Spo0J family partition protein [Bacillota bacterium]